MIPHSTYSADLVPSDIYLFANLNILPIEKIFGSNKEVFADTEAYFAANDKSYQNVRGALE